MLLFPKDEPVCRTFSDEELSILLELVTCFLLQCEVFKDSVSISQCLLYLLISLNVLLLASNKKQECEGWIKAHLSELVSVKSANGDSLLHRCMLEIEHLLIHKVDLPMEPFVRLLVEEGKMEVNDVGRNRQDSSTFTLG